jgi:hypothetical protein
MPSCRKSSRNTHSESPPAKRRSSVDLARLSTLSAASTARGDDDVLNQFGLTAEDALESLARAPRERAESFHSDVSDDPDAFDRMMAAQAAAAANACAARRSDTSEVSIKELELDHVCDSIYENMEEEAMLEIMRDLQSEIIGAVASMPASKPSIAKGASKNSSKASSIEKCEKPKSPTESAKDYLWNVVATPAMMMAFSSTVANGPPPALPTPAAVAAR